MPFKFNPLTGSIDSVNSRSEDANFEGEITTPRFETQDLGIKVIGKDGGTAQIDIQPDLGDSNADKWKVGAEDNGHFFISNKDSGDWDKSIAANRSGNAELYFDGGTAKFGTTASGATITHSTAASTLKLYRSDTPSDDDNIADLFFLGKKSDGADHTYGYIRSTVTDVTTGTTDSKLTFATKTDGSDKEIVFQDGGANFAGHIQFSGSTSSLTNISQPIITRSGSSDGSYPFDGHGHLILQSRGDGSNRDIVFATGTNGANKTIFAASGNATFKVNVAEELTVGQAVTKTGGGGQGGPDAFPASTTITGIDFATQSGDQGPRVYLSNALTDNIGTASSNDKVDFDYSVMTTDPSGSAVSHNLNPGDVIYIGQGTTSTITAQHYTIHTVPTSSTFTTTPALSGTGDATLYSSIFFAEKFTNGPYSIQNNGDQIKVTLNVSLD